MDFQLLIWFVLAGIAGGFLAGLLGVGGGLVFIPVIQKIIENKVPLEDVVAYTISNSLMIIFVVGVSSFAKQKKLKNTDLKASLITGFSAVISSLLVTYLLKITNTTDMALFKTFFSIVMLLTIARVLYGQIKNKTENDVLNMPAYPKFVPAGLLAGVITSLTGLGGGVIMVPYFNKILKLPVKFSTGLSLSVIPIIALPLIVFYLFSSPQKEVIEGYQTGYIMWTAVLPISLFAAIASQYGIKVSQKLKSSVVMLIFLLFAIFTLVRVWLF